MHLHLLKKIQIQTVSERHNRSSNKQQTSEVIQKMEKDIFGRKLRNGWHKFDSRSGRTSEIFKKRKGEIK